MIFVIIYPVPITLLYARIFCFVYCSRTTDYKSITLPQNKPGGSYKPIPPPKPKNYRPPQTSLTQTENNGNEVNNTHQHSKSYSIATSHVSDVFLREAVLVYKDKKKH